MTTEKHNEHAEAGIEPMIEFDARAIPPMAIFMAQNDLRYYLCGMCVIPAPAGGVIIAATDGHRLALYHDKDGKANRKTIIKVSPGVIAACKKKRRLGTTAVRMESGRLIVSNSVEGELFVQAGKAEIEGKYPDVFKVVPPSDVLVPGLHGGMKAAYLKQLGEASKALGPIGACYYAAPSHYSNGTDGNGAIVTRFGGRDDFIVVTMPIRCDDWPVKKPIPAHFAAPKAKDKTEAAKC